MELKHRITALLCALWLGLCCQSSLLHAAVGESDATIKVQADPPPPVPLIWKRVRGLATEIAISSKGHVYSLDQEGLVWRWRGKRQVWTLLPGRFQRLTVGPKQELLAIDKKGRVNRYNGLWWVSLSDAPMVDLVTSGEDRIFAISKSGGLVAWDARNRRWVSLGGRKLRKVSVDHLGRAVVLDQENRIFRRDKDSFVRLPGKARDLSVGPGGAVFITGLDGALYRRDAEAEAWVADGLAEKSDLVAVGPGGYPWVVTEDGRIFATNDFVTEDDLRDDRDVSLFDDQDEIFSNNGRLLIVLPDLTDASPISFTLVPGEAEEISISRNGAVFVADANSNVFLYSVVEGAFQQHPGRFGRIAAERDGALFGIDGAKRIVFQDGDEATFISEDFKALEIAVGPEGTLYATDLDAQLFRFDPETDQFIDQFMTAFQIAVDPQGGVWGVDLDGRLFRCDERPCRVLPSPDLRDIGIGPDGSIFLVSADDILLSFDPVEEETKVITSNIARVSVGPSGRPWVIDSDGRIFASTFFPRDESADSELAAEARRQQGFASPGFSFPRSYVFRRVRVAFDTDQFFEGPEISSTGAVFVRENEGGQALLGVYDPVRDIVVRDRRYPALPIGPTLFSRNHFAIDSDERPWFFDDPSIVAPGTSGITVQRPNDDGSFTPILVTASPIMGPGTADLAIGGGDSTYLVGPNARIHSYVRSIDDFIVFDGNIIYAFIASDPDGIPWVVETTGVIRRFDIDTGQWTFPAAGQVLAIGIEIGAGGEVFIIDSDQNLRIYDEDNDRFDLIQGVSDVFDLAVDPDGLPWVRAKGPGNIDILMRGELR